MIRFFKILREKYEVSSYARTHSTTCLKVGGAFLFVGTVLRLTGSSTNTLGKVVQFSSLAVLGAGVFGKLETKTTSENEHSNASVHNRVEAPRKPSYSTPSTNDLTNLEGEELLQALTKQSQQQEGGLSQWANLKLRYDTITANQMFNYFNRFNNYQRALHVASLLKKDVQVNFYVLLINDWGRFHPSDGSPIRLLRLDQIPFSKLSLDTLHPFAQLVVASKQKEPAQRYLEIFLKNNSMAKLDWTPEIRYFNDLIPRVSKELEQMAQEVCNLLKGDKQLLTFLPGAHRHIADMILKAVGEDHGKQYFSNMNEEKFKQLLMTAQGMDKAVKDGAKYQLDWAQQHKLFSDERLKQLATLSIT